jgi:hypothetical protein
MGGESQKASLNQVTGYSTYAHCIGKPSYLEPNSGSLQKPIEGVYPHSLNSPLYTVPLYKGAIVTESITEPQQKLL